MDTKDTLERVALGLKLGVEEGITSKRAVFLKYADDIILLKKHGVSFAQLYRAMKTDLKKSHFDNLLHYAINEQSDERERRQNQLMRMGFQTRPPAQEEFTKTEETTKPKEDYNTVVPFVIPAGLMQDLHALNTDLEHLRAAKIRNELDLVQYISKLKSRIK